MYQPHHQLKLYPKKYKRHRQKEESGSHTEEQGHQEMNQLWHRAENMHCTSDSSDEEAYHSNPSSTKAKIHSKTPSTGEEEFRKDAWPGRSLTESIVVMEQWGEAPMSEPGISTPRCTRTPLLSPEDILNYQTLLRKHPTRNSEGHILIQTAPTGSCAAENTIPMALKTTRSSFVNKSTGVCYQFTTTLHCPSY